MKKTSYALLVAFALAWFACAGSRDLFNSDEARYAEIAREMLALGDWLGGALMWHFAAMWVLVINGLVYVTLGFATGRFRRKLWPIRPSEIIADIKAALTFKLSHDDLSHYNAVQKVLYVGIILVAGTVGGWLAQGGAGIGSPLR